MNTDDEQSKSLHGGCEHEEPYSIWPVGREILNGWKDAGKSGTRQGRLDWIKEHWTDMRPLGIRKKTDNVAATGS